MKRICVAVLLTLTLAQPALAWDVTATWQGIKTKSIDQNAVACLAVAIVGSIKRFGPYNYEAYTPWFGDEARWYVPSGSVIWAKLGSAEAAKMATYTRASSTISYQTISYRSLNGKYSQCVIDRINGVAEWSGEF